MVRDGHVRVKHPDGQVLEITQPSVLLYQRPLAHRVIADPQHGADFTCARLRHALVAMHEAPAEE